MVRRMAEIVSDLFEAFDYSRSPEFLRSVAGKSAEFIAMKQRLITPMKRAEIQKRLGRALEKVWNCDDVFELVEPSRHAQIKELRNLLSEVSNLDDESQDK